MIIDTNKKYEMRDILGFMSDLIANRISNGYKIDFEQEFYIRNCTHIEDEIGETYMVTTGETVSILTYLEGDFDDPDKDILIVERHFESEAIDEETFPNVKVTPVAKFKTNYIGMYRLDGVSFNL